VSGLPPDASEPTATGRPLLPWEQPKAPFFESLLSTLRLFLTQPSEAFARMPVVPDLMRPILYAVIVGWIGIVANQLYGILVRILLLPLLPDRESFAMVFALPTALSVTIMFVAPIFVVIGVFIWSAILHLFVLLVGGGGGKFSGTIRVVCYANTTQILQVVPICGGLISLVWNIVLLIIGLSAAHGIGKGRAALAVLLPLAICCACAVTAGIVISMFVVGLLANAS
jgi:hypothetical protein